MNMALRHNYFRRLLNAIYIGGIIGFITGLVISIINITAQHYIEYKLYNIALFDLQYNLTKYTVISALCAVIVLAGILIIEQAYRRHLNPENKGNEDLTKKRVIASVLFFILAAAYGTLFYLYYSTIDTYLDKGFEVLFFGAYNQYLSNLYIVIIILLAFMCLILSIISTYILIKLKIIETLLRLASAIISSKLSSGIGAAAIAIVIIFNLFAYIYTSTQKKEGPNIVLITIDTLRADHLGAYGYERNTSPNIDKLAEKGILFENAYSQAPWTLPFMVSMNTSLYPQEHGVTDKKYKLSNSMTTIAEYMSNNFYKTIGIVSNRFLTPQYGLSQGFDIFKLKFSRNHGTEKTSAKITDTAIKYISIYKNDKFYLWIHYMDPHAKYMKHPEFGYSSGYLGKLSTGRLTPGKLNRMIPKLTQADIQYVKDLYDEEISFTDKHIGRFIDALGKFGLTDKTVIIITADHGEEFLDKSKFGHGISLYQELIHVPLIIYVPSKNGRQTKRVNTNVEVRSIAKTISDLSVRDNHSFAGKNLLIVAEEKDRNYIAYSQSSNSKKRVAPLETIVSGYWKLIKTLDDSSYELYDLKNDPLEKINLFESELQNTAQVKKELISKLKDYRVNKEVKEEKVKLSQKDIKHLKALGYIE